MAAGVVALFQKQGWYLKAFYTFVPLRGEGVFICLFTLIIILNYHQINSKFIASRLNFIYFVFCYLLNSTSKGVQ